MLSSASKLLVAGSVLVGSALLQGSASAQNLACPSNTQTSFIVKSSCVTSTGGTATGINPAPCQLGSAVLMEDARTVELGICSKSLKRVVGVRVLLPKNYYSEWSALSPLLYLLHGSNGNSTMLQENDFRDWTNNTTVEHTSYDTNAFVVTPEGGPSGWYSDWRTTPSVLINWWPTPFLQTWETHFFSEVVPLVEATFHNNHQRVIAGLSMGGMGAVSFAERGKSLHNVAFRAAASFSGDLETQKNYLIPQATLLKKGVDANALWGDPKAAPSAQNWPEHDPIQNLSQLYDVPVWVSAGNGQNPANATDIDSVEVGAWYTSTDFANALVASNNAENARRAAAHALPVKGYLVRDMGSITNIGAGCAGQHNWANWSIEINRAWPFIAKHLTAAPGIVPPATGLLPLACGQVPIP